MPTYDQLVDDRERIPDASILLRRVGWSILGGRSRFTPDSEIKINANCFSDYTEEDARAMGLPGPCMSVGALHMLVGEGEAAPRMLRGHDDYGLVRVEAGKLRSLQKGDGTPCPQGIMWSPTDDEPWHCVVFDLSGKRSGAGQKAIMRLAEWEIPLSVE